MDTGLIPSLRCCDYDRKAMGTGLLARSNDITVKRHYYAGLVARDAVSVACKQ